MAAGFDAVGPTAACQVITVASGGTRSWTHTAGTGGGTVLVWLTCGVTGASAGALGSFASVTYGGNAMAPLGSVASNNSTWGGIFLYGITGQAGGANTVAVGTYTIPAGSTFGQILGVSVSVTGGSSFGTVFTTFGSAAAGSLNITNTGTGGLCVAGMCDGTGGEAATTGTQRFKLDQSGSNTGNTVGSTLASNGGTTTLSFSLTSDFFGIIGVEVKSPGGQQERMPQQLSRITKHRRGASQRPQYAAQLPDVNILATTYNAAVSLPAPSLPPTHLFITGLSGGLSSTSADYFTDQLANPRWMWCDSTWPVVYSAGRAGGANTYQTDIDYLTSTRGGQGYTALQCNLLPNNEYVASGLVNVGGFHPFVTGVDPGSGLTSGYWTVLDYLLASAANQGITMFLNLCMGEDISSGVMGAWTATQKTQYGNAVATRYLSTPNIIWMMGDDGGADATTATNIMTGIRAAGDTRPVAFENGQETTSRFGLKLSDAQPWNSSGYIAYQWCYNYAPSYQSIEYAYAEASPIPVLRGDGYYFGTIGGPDDKVSREQFWWSVSSGSRGYSWGTSDGGMNGGFAAGWKTNLTMAAEEAGTAGDFQNAVFPACTTYLKTLPNWQKLRGDIANAFITAGRGTRAAYQTEGIQNQYTGATPDTYVSGSYANDGSIAMIYFSRGVTTTITIDQTKLATGYTGTWVDPATCATTTATTGSTYTKPAGANAAGDHDWLLLLQAPGAQLPDVAMATRIAP